jgi:hypothetical protein
MKTWTNFDIVFGEISEKLFFAENNKYTRQMTLILKGTLSESQFIRQFLLKAHFPK